MQLKVETEPPDDKHQQHFQEKKTFQPINYFVFYSLQHRGAAKYAPANGLQLQQ